MVLDWPVVLTQLFSLTSAVFSFPNLHANQSSFQTCKQLQRKLDKSNVETNKRVSVFSSYFWSLISQTFNCGKVLQETSI